MNRYHAQYPTVSMGAQTLITEVESTLGIKTSGLGLSINHAGKDPFYGFAKTSKLFSLDMRKAKKLRAKLEERGFAASIDGDICVMHKDYAVEAGILSADVRMQRGKDPQVIIKVGLIEAKKKPAERDLEKRPYTLRELSEAFDRVKPQGNWKAPIDSNIDPELKDIISASILHFTGGPARFKADGKRLLVRAVGYTAIKNK